MGCVEVGRQPAPPQSIGVPGNQYTGLNSEDCPIKLLTYGVEICRFWYILSVFGDGTQKFLIGFVQITHKLMSCSFAVGLNLQC